MPSERIRAADLLPADLLEVEPGRFLLVIGLESDHERQLVRLRFEIGAAMTFPSDAHVRVDARAHARSVAV